MLDACLDIGGGCAQCAVACGLWRLVGWWRSRLETWKYERTIPRSMRVARSRESRGGILITVKDPIGIHDP